VAEVEVYGGPSQAPYFKSSEIQYTIDRWHDVNNPIADLQAKDFQEDTISYKIQSDLPIRIDQNGKIFLTTAKPNVGHYGVVVSISDGVNTVEKNIDIEVTENIAHHYGIATQESVKYGKDKLHYYQDPANAIDNNFDTHQTTNGWLQIQLPRGSNITKLVVHNVNNYWRRRLEGTKVYFGLSKYTGDLSQFQPMHTLTGEVAAQVFTYPDAKDVNFVLLKIPADLLHIREIEIFGEAPAEPEFTKETYQVSIDKWQTKSKPFFDMGVVDYQQNTLSYNIVNQTPFRIDTEGKIYVDTLLNAGQYNLEIEANDGLHTSTQILNVEVLDTIIPPETMELTVASPSVTGTLPNTYKEGSSVEVIIDGVSYPPQISADGQWSINIDPPLPQGIYDATMVVDDERIIYPDY